MNYVVYSWIVLSVTACAGELDDESFKNPRSRGDSGAAEQDAAVSEPHSPTSDSGTQAHDAQPDARDAEGDEPDDAGSPVTDAGADAGADAEPNEPEPPACDFRALVEAKCGNASCHGAPAVGSGLDLTSASLPTRIAGRMAGGSCTDKLLVDPDEPNQSALYLRVTGTACGVKMPLGGSLTPNEQACILTWIEGL